MFVVLFFLSGLAIAQDGLVGHWEFDDPANLTKATIGANLILSGGHTAVEGPAVQDGAVNIGIGSNYIVPHGIDPNGGGSRVNEFSLVMDIKIPDYGKWYCIYQSDLTNTDDGEWFINTSGYMGVGQTGYTPDKINPGEWYRIAISVKNGTQYNYYYDGYLLLNGAAGDIDGRFSLNTAFILFGDENGEDAALDVADVKLYSRALSDQEIADLGGYNHKPNSVVEPDSTIFTYLQTPSPTSIHVCWHASGSTESIVEYGLTEGLGNIESGGVIEFDVYTTWHTVKLTGLSPETVYYYKAVTDTMESEIQKFKTPPVAGDSTQHIRFVFMGDNRSEPDVFTRVVDSMKAKVTDLYGPNIEENLNLVLNVGDVVTTGGVISQYIREYFRPLYSVSGNVPVMVSIGNHENEAEHFYNYMKYEELGGPEGEKYYSFKYGRILFIAINSNWQLRNETQVAWLDTLMAAAEADNMIDWVFAFCHHPGRSELWPDGNTAYVQDQIIPTLNKYKKADMLAYGHSHNYERGAVQEGNLRLVLSGGAGSQLDRWGMYGNQTNYPEIQKAYDHYCYTLIDIDIPNRSYQATNYSLGHPQKELDNTIIDSFSRDKKALPPTQPGLVSPLSGSEKTPPFDLEAQDFTKDYQIMSSHFQVTATQGDYNEASIDKIRDFEDIYGDSGPPDYLPIDLNANIDLSKFFVSGVGLEDGKTYWWRMRYRDKNLQWTEWTEERSFSVSSSTAIDDQKNIIVKRTALYQNYPNPFNSTTIIRFDLKKLGFVSLYIYSIEGKLIKTLVNNQMPAGAFSINWDGKDAHNHTLPSGTYILKLETPDYSKSEKAVLIK
jgi:hypothetical protein